MNKLKLFLLLAITFFLEGCDCACDSNKFDTTIASNSTTISSAVYIYGDGCGASDGSVNSSGYPTGSCDSTGQYVNRGRWVKVPNAGVTTDSIVNIGIQGSIFYCSTGYDNQNIFPNFIVYPGPNTVNQFSDNSQMPLQSGQMVVIKAVPDAGGTSVYSGVTIGSNTSGVTTDCITTSSPYSSLREGSCRGFNLFGLSVYVGRTEIVTLDMITNSNKPYYPYAQSRQAYMYSYIQPNNLSPFYTSTNYKYSIALNNQGNGEYVFQVPPGINGLLGFNIAKGRGTTGSGQYAFQVMTTPPACYVEQSQAYSQPDNRGALELLVSSTNPNLVDNAISAFNALNNGNAIDPYYDQLNKYISSFSGIQINSNASVLSSLVVAPNLSPVVILAPSYSFVGPMTGNIWLKVRDDYYSDNVGEYYVTATVTTKTAGMASQFITDLITPITTLLYSLSEQVYTNFTSQHFLNIVRLCLLIYIIIYGAEFALGLTTISSYDIIIRIFKLAVVIELFNPSSFAFFNTYFFQLFISGSNHLTELVTGDYTNSKSGMFSFVDDIFNVYFSAGTWIKLAALLPDLVGFLFLLIIIFLIFLYLLILARAIVAYLLAVVGVSLLVSLAPMFIVLILFERTKKYFDNWVKHLVGYALQPVMMFGALYVMTMIFLDLWNNLMDFDVCWGGIINLYFPLSSWTQGFLPNVDLKCIQYLKIPGGINYINMFGGAFALTVFTFAINNMMSHIPEMTDAITGVFVASAVSSKANETVQKGMDTAMKGASAVAGAAKKLGNAASNLARGGGGGGGGDASKSRGGGMQMTAPGAGSGVKMSVSGGSANPAAGEGAPKKPQTRLQKLASAAKAGVKLAAKAGMAVAKGMANANPGQGQDSKKREGGKMDELKQMAGKALEEASTHLDKK